MSRFSKRSQEPELMDALTDQAAYQTCLANLASVNRLTFTHRPFLSWLGRVTRGMETFSLLDVACGHGDLLRSIHRWAARKQKHATLTGLDLNPGSAVATASATPPEMAISWRTGDVFADRPDPKPDFIVSSQFAHHLDDAQLRAFFLWMDANAARGWFILDLHRHPLAYYGFRAMSWAAGWHPVMRHDGMVSVTRGFSRAELARAAEGLDVNIRWKLPFRFAIEAGKPAS